MENLMNGYLVPRKKLRAALLFGGVLHHCQNVIEPRGKVFLEKHEGTKNGFYSTQYTVRQMTDDGVEVIAVSGNSQFETLIN